MEPQGKRKRGRPKNSWCRGIISEVQAINTTWGEAKRTERGGKKLWLPYVPQGRKWNKYSSTTLNCLAVRSYEHERTRWKLFRKRAIRTNFDIYVLLTFNPLPICVAPPWLGLTSSVIPCNRLASVLYFFRLKCGDTLSEKQVAENCMPFGPNELNLLTTSFIKVFMILKLAGLFELMLLESSYKKTMSAFTSHLWSVRGT